MSRMDFPSTNLVAGTTTHTVGDNTWLWNGYAWIKEPHGHTGQGVVDSICGVTGDICVCYPGLTITGQTLCIDRTATIHVGGVSGDGYFKFAPAGSVGSMVEFKQGGGGGETGYLYIKGDANTALYLEQGKAIIEGSNLELVEGAELVATESISVGHDIAHIGDNDTMISFGTDQIDFKAGGVGTKLTNDRLHVLRGLSADHGATFAGGVNFESLNAIKDGWFLTQDGVNVGYLDQSNGLLRLSIYSMQTSRELCHLNDEDTFIRFPDANKLQLSAGGNVFVEGTDNNVSVQGSTFDSSIIYTEGISAGTGISGAYIYAPGTSTVGGCVLGGGNIIGTATLATLASTANLATSASQVTMSASSTDADLSVALVDNLGGGTSASLVKVDSGAGNNGFRYNPGADLLTLGGVSDGHGATFGGDINLLTTKLSDPSSKTMQRLYTQSERLQVTLQLISRMEMCRL